jgi:hypothetical protein
MESDSHGQVGVPLLISNWTRATGRIVVRCPECGKVESLQFYTSAERVAALRRTDNRNERGDLVWHWPTHCGIRMERDCA